MTKTELQERYGAFFDLCCGQYSEHSCTLIHQAVEMANRALEGLTRYDGSPLLDHSVATAAIVVGEVGLGRNSAVAAILHDAARMGLIGLAEVNRLFGEAPVGIILGMNDISSIRTKADKEQIDNFRDLIISYSTDPRVILLKLADRLEVMRKIDIFPADKQLRKSWESMNLYAQIAHKLGLYNIKSELEEIAFAHIEPKAYAEITKRLEEGADRRAELIANVLAPIEQKMRENGIRYHVKSRTKSVYSIWRKMERQKVSFDEVFDIFAIRIIIDCPPAQEKMLCWNVFSIVTDFYTPNPERMRDWISIPKSNGYESLHATVSAFGEWVEIQIRTERMDEVAERGIAAHWRYKGVGGGTISHEQWLARLREIIEESSDKSGIAKKLDTSLTSREVFVFTPKGDLRKLPEGATVLDFAFDIHSGVGSQCVGAKIGDRNVPIKEKLHNGDIVTILTSKSQKPKSDWLSIVVTNKAKSRIKAYLREEEAKLANLGREELERKLKNWKMTIAIDDAVNVLCKHYKLRTGLELYGRIVDEKVDMMQVKEVIGRHLEGGDAPQPPKPRNEPVGTKPQESEEELVLGDDVHGLKYKAARCCNPIFGDEVFGFTTIREGITIHRHDCPNAKRLKEMYPYRVIAARWKGETSKGSFIATIRIVADDSTGMLNRLTDTIGGLHINIRSLSLAPARDNTLSGSVNVEVPSSSVADMVTYAIQKLDGVRKAYRVNK
ncbi:MAG: bifunctional (p)ppGpp synthetase/guanosine-3',5'-bis(diphosphate) 3'-pyrophosphohydrolase [Rikenellaceae bacterium]|nr:bifunctional (p)ppGpp synthetase/guanosine-3',5'-bis(diphosphate) 3'-pyrophosphohydrolase [Rikenellaceae bacterium]